jgi:tetratricopeptide (TPR) repeat protein
MASLSIRNRAIIPQVSNYLAGGVRAGISIIIDPDVGPDQLPLWLRNINSPYITSPQVAARLIREKIDSIRRGVLPALFMGRGQDIEKAESLLTPSLETRSPKMAVFWGLIGIGRRALAQRVARDILDFQRTVSIPIETGDSLPDLRVKLAAKIESFSTMSQLKSLQTEADGASPQENLDAIKDYFDTFTASREMPIFVDNGGFLDDDGVISPPIQKLISYLFLKQVYTIFVSRRRPADFSLEDGLNLPHLRVNQLGEDSTRRLLIQIAANQELGLSKHDMDSLIPAIKGYPPAAYQCVSLMKEYGKEILVRDSYPLVQFRETSFLRLLQGSGKFTENEKSILNLLPQFDVLPLPVISKCLSISQAEADLSAMNLLNRAFLQIDDDGFFGVSDPIREAVNKVFGSTTINYEGIDDALRDFISKFESVRDAGLAPLALYRARFKSHVLAGKGRQGLFYMASDLVRLQQAWYHGQDYLKSIEYGKAALDVRPHETEILKYLARAYIQIEEHSEFEGVIEEMRKHSAMKEVKFLEGFAYRKRGENHRAISSYNSALALGMRGVAVHRELGVCLFEEGNLSEAKTHLGIASGADPGNKFVLDVEIKIAILEHRIGDARVILEQLEQVDTRARALHRRSTVEYADNRFNEAFSASGEALKFTDRPQFELLSQFVNTAIITNHLPEAAEKLRIISQRFKGLRADIQNLLQGRYSLAMGEIGDAEAYCARISDKSLKSRSRLKADILSKKGLTIPVSDRHALELEIGKLRQEAGVDRNIDMLKFDME